MVSEEDEYGEHEQDECLDPWSDTGTGLAVGLDVGRGGHMAHAPPDL